MLELRPRAGSLERFVETVNRLQRPEGYRLAASFEDGHEQAVAVAGFRTAHFQSWGYALYVDDLSTLARDRGRGHAGALMGWLIAEAQRLGCAELHLDSGVGPDRQAAHRLYLNKRMRISAHHFALELG
jgi:GNAT superfamily N-acetyltransferase